MKKTASALPTNPGPGQCPDCWVLPSRTHELSCPEVSVEQMRAEFDRLREEDARWERRGRLMSLAGRCVLFVALLLAAALAWGWVR